MTKKPAKRAPAKAAPKARAPRKSARALGPDKLTDQQRIFVDVYMETSNRIAAATAAGYANPVENAWRVFNARSIQNEMARRYHQRREYSPLTEHYVIATLMEAVERCMQSRVITDKEGKPVTIQTDAGTTMVLSVFDVENAMKGLKDLGGHIGMFRDKGDNPGATDIADYLLHNLGTKISAPQSAPLTAYHDDIEDAEVVSR